MSYTIKQPIRNINCDIDDSTVSTQRASFDKKINEENINFDTNDSTVSTQRASFDKKINEENINSRIMPYTTKNVSFGR